MSSATVNVRDGNTSGGTLITNRDKRFWQRSLNIAKDMKSKEQKSPSPASKWCARLSCIPTISLILFTFCGQACVAKEQKAPVSISVKQPSCHQTLTNHSDNHGDSWPEDRIFLVGSERLYSAPRICKSDQIRQWCVPGSISGDASLTPFPENDFSRALDDLQEFSERRKSQEFRCRLYENIDFTKFDLSGIDFSGSIFVGVTIGGIRALNINLSHTQFNCSSIARVYFSDSDLSSVSFHRSQISDVSIFHSLLNGSHFRESFLINFNVSSGEMKNARFSHSTLVAPSFRNLDMSSAGFENVLVVDGDFYNAHIDNATAFRSGTTFLGTEFYGTMTARNANFDHSNFHCTNIYCSEENCDFSNASFSNADFLQANFEHLDLSGSIFTSATIFDTHFVHTMIPGGNFNQASIIGSSFDFGNLEAITLARAVGGSNRFHDSDLSRSDFTEAALPFTDFQNAMLRGATFLDANLQLSNFNRTDLMGAIFEGTNLTNSVLTRTRLSDAQIFKVQIGGSLWEPREFDVKPYSLGELSGVDSLIFFPGRETGLYILRENFRSAGLRGLERQATFAIESGRTRHMLAGISSGATLKNESIIGGIPRGILFRPEHFITREAQPVSLSKDGAYFFLNQIATRVGEGAVDPLKADLQIEFQIWGDTSITAKVLGVLRYVFLELPVGYGLWANRSLVLLFGIILFMTLVYYAILIRPNDKSVEKEAQGLYKVSPSGAPITLKFSTIRVLGGGSVQKITSDQHRVLLEAFRFSAFSAFHFGWRELSVSSWLSRLQPTEWGYHARGVIRVLSGLQALASLYLVIVWALFQFGRPLQ